MVEGSNPSEPVCPGGNFVKEKENTGREFNPLKHIMVPNHEILIEDEVKKVLTEFNVEKEQLPKIRVIDPTVVASKAKIGDVIRITRESKTAGRSYYYRMVIA
ncbi:DNA-directed RNA polymerase subunit H [Methanosarcinales archaeon]|nr:DNA-directed RNA polymerase subunit H [Methanosarcinales archaeon]